MANLSKIKRDSMIAFLEQLKKEHNDDASIRAFNEIENHLREKKYGLVWEEHSEEVDELLAENIPILTADPERRLCKNEALPWNFIIEGDNLQALYLLEKTHKGKVDCIYIDPPYNNRNRSWKYNNDYVDNNDTYKHSKWISLMKTRLTLARRLLNPNDSVLIVTIDEKEYLPSVWLMLLLNRFNFFWEAERFILSNNASTSLRYCLYNLSLSLNGTKPIEFHSFISSRTALPASAARDSSASNASKRAMTAFFFSRFSSSSVFCDEVAFAFCSKK